MDLKDTIVYQQTVEELKVTHETAEVEDTVHIIGGENSEGVVVFYRFEFIEGIWKRNSTSIDSEVFDFKKKIVLPKLRKKGYGKK